MVRPSTPFVVILALAQHAAAQIPSASGPQSLPTSTSSAEPLPNQVNGTMESIQDIQSKLAAAPTSRPSLIDDGILALCMSQSSQFPTFPLMLLTRQCGCRSRRWSP